MRLSSQSEVAQRDVVVAGEAQQVDARADRLRRRDQDPARGVAAWPGGIVGLVDGVGLESIDVAAQRGRRDGPCSGPFEMSVLRLVGGRDSPAPPRNRRVLSHFGAAPGVMDGQARAPLRVPHDGGAELWIRG